MTEEAKKPEEGAEVIEGAEKPEVKAEEKKSPDEIMDNILDQEEGKEKPGASSTSKKPEEMTPEEKAKADENPDLAKKEADAKAEEAKKAADEIPQEFHKHEAWIRMKEAKDKAVKEAEEAVAKAAELEKGGVLTDEQKALLDNVKQLTSSKQFMEDKLRAEGFKDEVIAEKLAEAGFDVKSTESDLDIAAKALNLDVNSLSDQDKGDISNLVKISDALLQSRLGKILPSVLNPISEQVAGLTSKESGLKIHDDFVAKVTDDGVLDYEKDLAPDITKFLDDNPKTTQKDVAEFMQKTYHAKLVLHKKAVEKKDERNKKIEDNRPGGEGSKVRTTLPDKTGDFDKDADAVFDSLGIHS